jgi:cytochrome c-type biogenesis protein
MGAAFGFGWTPCVGPILGSILAVAAQGGDVARASALLLAYSFGLGVPFLATALALSWMKPLLSQLTRHSRLISIIAGVVLMVLGVAMATGQIERLGALFS